jgi:hypothetical protein
MDKSSITIGAEASRTDEISDEEVKDEFEGID